MNWRRSLIGAAVALPIIALLAYGMTVDPRELPSTMPGRVAPEFSLRVMDSEPPDTVRLVDERGSVVVVNFWASWCLACRDEHTDLSVSATRYADSGVKFYGVIYNDSESNARRWIREMGGQPYPALVDERSRTAIDYGLYAVPETVIIDQQGKVVYKHIGPITSAQLQRIIDPLLANGTAAKGERPVSSQPGVANGASRNGPADIRAAEAGS
ncbi:MAG TPA: redoxin domain-containing protein [Longimicrobiales bacterium]|nr:redoxin domain-containing protein [Longimicrobiales bacterium]